MHLCCKWAGGCEINPWKLLISRILNGPGTKSRLLEGPETFWPIKWHEHFESLKWPHFVIFKGLFHNPKPNLQQRCIGNFMPMFYSFWGLFVRTNLINQQRNYEINPVSVAYKIFMHTLTCTGTNLVIPVENIFYLSKYGMYGGLQ